MKTIQQLLRQPGKSLADVALVGLHTTKTQPNSLVIRSKRNNVDYQIRSVGVTFTIWDGITANQTQKRSALNMKEFSKTSAAMLIMLTLIGALLTACVETGSRGSGTPNTPLPGDPPSLSPSAGKSSTVPEYDAFSDPNVVWGTESDYAWIEVPPEIVIVFDGVLEDALAVAEENNLVAFYFRSLYRRYSDWAFPIDLEKLVIHEELDGNGILTDLVQIFCESGTSKDYAAIQSYLSDFEAEHIWPLNREISDIKWEIGQEIDRENSDGGPSPGTDEWYVREEAVTDRAMEDEDFRLLYEKYKYYLKLVQDFQYSWHAQQVRGIRDWMTGLGFIPIFSLDDVCHAKYNEMPYIKDEHRYSYEDPLQQFSEMMLAFVGTPEQICSLKDTVSELGCGPYDLCGLVPFSRPYFCNPVD